MTLLGAGFGLEEIATEAFVVLMQGLNDEIAATEVAMAPLDERIAGLRGIDYVPVALEVVEGGHFYLGHVPSLILDETPVTSYPAVSVMAYRSQPAPGSAEVDQASIYKDALYVEALVKASPTEGEEVCDKRIWRMAEAINRVLMRNQTLGGLVHGLEEPTCVISEVFTRPFGDLDDTDWFWQAARVEYGVGKFSPFE